MVYEIDGALWDVMAMLTEGQMTVLFAWSNDSADLVLLVESRG